MKRPRVLVVDDVLGRQSEGENAERAGVCADLLLNDVTEGAGRSKQRVREPVADAVFARGQRPLLARRGDTVENDLEGLLRIVRAGWTDRPPGTLPWSLVLLDLCFRTGTVAHGSGIPPFRAEDESAEGLFGLRALKTLHSKMPDLPIVVYSSLPRGMVAEQFTAAGASDFLPKADEGNAEAFLEKLRTYGLLPDPSGRIIGGAIPLLVALKSARQAAAGKAPCLSIESESGTGKELLARYVSEHDAARRKGPFVTMNSANLSTALYTSALFGHEKGDFTGAVKSKAGLLAEADKGWLFLDEIGNMPWEVQVGLLRVIEEQVVASVGAGRSRPVSVRFIFATDTDLDAAMAEKRFGMPFVMRARTGGIHRLPPLRQRKEDIPDLVEHFVREAEMRIGATRREVTVGALAALNEHSWPGNIRELETSIRLAVEAYPKLEYLQPVHLGQLSLPLVPKVAGPESTKRLEEERGGGKPVAPRQSVPGESLSSHNVVVNEPGDPSETNLDSLLESIDAFEFTPHGLAADQLAKRSDDIENAFGALMTKYLKFALWLSKTSNSKEDAKPVLQRAVRWATGRDLTGYQPYDVVIRLSQTGPATDSLWNRDPELKGILEKAMRYRRPHKPGGKKAGPSTPKDVRSD